MDVRDFERSELIKRFKRELVGPLRGVGVSIGELDAAARLHAETELSKAAMALGGIQAVVDNHAWERLGAVESKAGKILGALDNHARQRLGAVGETIDIHWPHAAPAGSPDGSGTMRGTDTRTPDQKAADPLSSAGEPCPIVPPIIPDYRYLPGEPGYLPTPPAVPTPPPATSTPATPGGPTRPTSGVTTGGVGGCGNDQYADVASRAAQYTAAQQYWGGDWLTGIGSEFLSGGLQNVFTAGVVNVVFGSVAEAIQKIIGKTSTQIAEQLKSNGCESDAMNGLLAMQGLFRAVNHWLPIIPPHIMTPIEYSANTLCPQVFPTAPEAIDAFLSGAIGESTAKTWLSQLGLCWEPQQAVIESRRAKPGMNELMVMRRRGIISESDFNNMMRQLGYTFDRNVKDLYALTAQLPPPSELIRFMTRDVADQKLVDKFSMDKCFTEKWTGNVKQWSEQQGIDEAYAKASWRAHWTIPSPGQLFSMLHRLRGKPVGDPTRVDLATIKEALQQQDILPFWIDKFIAISYRPLSRIDTRRAFDVGSIDKARVKQSYTEQGYDDHNAAALADFTERLRDSKILNTLPIKLFRAELINRQGAEARLLALNYDSLIVDDALTNAEKMQKGHSAVKAFGKGRITRAVAELKLTAHGLLAATFDPWLDDAARNYETGKVVRLFSKSVIDRNEAERRLTASGIDAAMFGPWLDDAGAAKGNHAAVAQFKRGVIDRRAAEALMKDDGLAAANIAKLLDRSEAEMKAETRAVCAKHLVDRFMRGELSADAVELTLTGDGMPPGLAHEIVERAKCELSAMGKDPSTAQLCDWLELGLIQPPDFIQRLRRLGWDDQEASNILFSCMSKINVHRAKEAEAQAKLDAAAMRKLEQQQTRHATAVAKENAAMEKRRVSDEKMRTRREKVLLDAADKLRGILGSDLQTAVQIVKDEKRRVGNDYALGVDDAMASVTIAVESGDIETVDDISPAVDAAAAAMAAAQEEIDAVGTNGRFTL